MGQKIKKFVTKKLHLDEMKIFCDKSFFVKTHPRALGAKNVKKGSVFEIFRNFSIKSTLKQKFRDTFHVTLLNQAEDNLAIILSHI